MTYTPYTFNGRINGHSPAPTSLARVRLGSEIHFPRCSPAFVWVCVPVFLELPQLELFPVGLSASPFVVYLIIFLTAPAVHFLQQKKKYFISDRTEIIHVIIVNKDILDHRGFSKILLTSCFIWSSKRFGSALLLLMIYHEISRYSVSFHDFPMISWDWAEISWYLSLIGETWQKATWSFWYHTFKICESSFFFFFFF